MAGRPVAFYFKQLDDAQGIVAEVRRLAALDRACREALPPTLGSQASVGSYLDGRLKIYATTGAVAAKLRQIAPRIAAGLRARGVEVTAIDVQVQAGIGKSAVREEPPRTLPETAVAGLEALRRSMPPSPLRDAIAHLLDVTARQAGKDKR